MPDARCDVRPPDASAAIRVCTQTHPKLMKLQNMKNAWHRWQEGRIGYALLWLLGVPLPVLLIVYLLRGH